jgi:hypothetical protein
MKMFYNIYVCCWMFWCLAGTIGMSLGSKIAKFVPQTRGTTLLAKYTLIAKFLSKGYAPAAPIAWLSGLGQLALACWSSSGSVVRSDAFLSTIYNFITPKQHLINAHNFKQHRIKNHGNLNMYVKEGTREVKPGIRVESIKEGNKLEPRHSC